jgi:hypothetical protein
MGIGWVSEECYALVNNDYWCGYIFLYSEVSACLLNLRTHCPPTHLLPNAIPSFHQIMMIP